MRIYSFFSRNGRNGNVSLVRCCVPTVSQKKAVSLSILDTIELTVVQFEKINRRMYQKIVIMLGYIQMSNGKILGEKYNRSGHRSAILAKRFKYINE